LEVLDLEIPDDDFPSEPRPNFLATLTSQKLGVARCRCPNAEGFLPAAAYVCPRDRAGVCECKESTMTDSSHGPDPEPAPPAPPKHQPRWPLIAGVIAIGLLLLGAVAWAIAAPDREACKSALGREIDAMLALQSAHRELGG
jgi:hypothetical protein